MPLKNTMAQSALVAGLSPLWFADDIDGLTREEQELAKLVNRVDKTSFRYGLEISAEKTKMMTNSRKPMEKKITVSGQKLETVNQFKCLGAILSEDGSKAGVLARAAQTSAALAKMKPTWRDNISLSTKLKLLHA